MKMLNEIFMSYAIGLGIKTMEGVLIHLSIAGFVVKKYRKQALESGYEVAARNLRKQGYPLVMARAILLGV